MASFTRADYERLIHHARRIAIIAGDIDCHRLNAECVELQSIAEAIFASAETVIGQQSPLFKEPSGS